MKGIVGIISMLCLGANLSQGALSYTYKWDFDDGTLDGVASLNGDTGAISSWTSYTLWNQAGNLAVCDEAEYGIATNAKDIHSAWTTAGDHTTNGDGGRYFIANGSSDTSQVVWQSGSALVVDQANTAYRFEAWITTVYSIGANDSPILTFQVGDGTNWYTMGQSQTFAQGSGDIGVWKLTYFDGVFSAPGSYYIRLLNGQDALGGNDFGVDDIFFGKSAEAPSIATNPVTQTQSVAAVPEPGTTAALVFLAAGLPLYLLRRRR